MAEITDYSTLQTEIENVLNRDDLTSDVPRFIQSFEDWARHDERLWRLSDRSTVTISGDGLALPSDFVKLESWYHDTETYEGPITIVPADEIARLKASHGRTGVPQFAAITRRRVRFAPVPGSGDSYNTKMTYWRRLKRLSDTETTNYLLDEMSSIYLYGSLLEAAPFLDEDERIPTWERRLYGGMLPDGRPVKGLVDFFEEAQQREMYGGGTIERNYTPIGG